MKSWMKAAILVVAMAWSGAAGAQASRRGKLDLAAARGRLLGSDPGAAAKAAADLGQSTEPAAHEALLDGLAMGLQGNAAMAALAALTNHPAPVDVATLRIYAGHRDKAVRAAAVAILQHYPDSDSRALLLAALGDPSLEVRMAAALAVAKAKVKDALPRLFSLLAKGDLAGISGLAALADVELAQAIAARNGQVPDAALARCLGTILLRGDFGPDEARVDIVRAMARMPGNEVIEELSGYVDATPAKPQRASRLEAESVVEARLGGGQ
jgi:hypothetical protein